MAERIGVEDARVYFAHPTQQEGCKVRPDDLPAEFEYWAQGPVCGVFHTMPWPGVWQAHYGVKPEGWGHTREPALAVLRAFWAAHEPARIVGWTDESNRAALAFSRRLGFVVDGVMPTPNGNVILQGWQP